MPTGKLEPASSRVRLGGVPDVAASARSATVAIMLVARRNLSGHLLNPPGTLTAAPAADGCQSFPGGQQSSVMLALAASLGFHASYDPAQHLVVISRELADIAVETAGS